VDVDRSATLDWDALRKKIAADGMRNSNCVAIAPTATISNIIGVDASIEPCFGNLSVKSNLSGEFTVINHYLVRDLKRLGLWDDVMVMDLKHFDGSLRPIDRVPQEVKALYATAFEVEPVWLVEAAARRQKWIDQAQSLNIYMAGASGQEAGRDLQARLAARPEDDLLPAHHQRDAGREVDRAIRSAECGEQRQRRVVA
jgi:ribonucleoside-diphosphate reductase alpha chain